MRTVQTGGEGSSSKTTGTLGEWVAADFLERLGYRIVERNYTYGRAGEIDIVARDGEVLVFCEVKARTSDRCGEPEYAITRKKQAQLRYLATAYLYEHGIDEQEVRFDAVAITFDGRCSKIDHFKNAF